MGLNDREILWVVSAYVRQHMHQLDVINLPLCLHQNYQKIVAMLLKVIRSLITVYLLIIG